MTKYILRVPATEQYAYIESEFEGTMEDAIAEYRRLTLLMKGGDGLDAKEWNAALDAYMNNGSMSPELHERMNKAQQWMIHELDKSVSRINYKNPKGEIHHSLK